MTTDDAAPSTRDRLLTSAIEVFLAKGYSRTRVQEIARRAGLTTGAIYSNFDDKASLLAEAIVRSATSAIEDRPTKAAGPPGDELAAATSSAVGGKPSQGDRLLLEALVAAVHEGDAGMLGEVIEAIDAPARAAVAAGDGSVDASLSDDAVVAVYRALALGGMVAKAAGLTEAKPAEVAAVVARMTGGLKGAKKPAAKAAAKKR